MKCYSTLHHSEFRAISSSENEPLFDHDSVDHEGTDHSLVTDGRKEPTSREFEQHYDMLHDIDHEKDIYRLRVSQLFCWDHLARAMHML